VPISAALAADLAALTASLDDPSIEIAHTIEQLSRDVGVAVRSYLGLSVRLSSPDQDIDFMVLTERAELARIRTSVRLALSPSTAGNTSLEARGALQVVLVFYAATAGAFVDLAADLSWLVGGGRDRLALDEDLPKPDQPPSRHTLGALSEMNQAIGVLIGQGHTPDTARHELFRLAAATGATIAAAAAAILAALDG
jgi:hypothetical protein